MASNDFKVVHIVAGSLDRGAARGALWLHLALFEQGVDSTLITNHPDTQGLPSVQTLTHGFFDRVIGAVVARLNSAGQIFYPNRKRRIFNSGFWGIRFHHHPAVKQADVVHLHWVNGVVSIRALNKLNKKIVWTVRDMWPITGGCHYSLECDRYQSGCGSCPQLGSRSEHDLSRLIFRAKKKYYPKGMTAVGISEWTTRVINDSGLFNESRVITILNNISCETFYPEDKRSARRSLGVEGDKPVVLVGSTNLDDFYKGADKLLEALSLFDESSFTLCVFGESDKKVLDSLGLDYVRLGYIGDNASLRRAYSAADVFVAPSVQETFGKTLAEALACGTPVVCFDATGPASIVSHKVDGYKAKPFSVADLAAGIEWVLNHEDQASLRNAARQNASNKFDSKVIANRYKGLYQSILGEEVK